jgi:NADPH:quinone reductase-like Zn-dependent oxidoreductase
MHIAQVTSWVEGPHYTTADDPPTPLESEIQLRILAAGAHQVVRSRASGKHYSAKTLPHYPGIDGVGRDESTGTLYYFMHFGDRFGSFAEYVNVPRDVLIQLPEGIDPVTLAASVNPAMSSWMAITQRTNNLPKDWTVLVVGATSASGRLAVHASKALGAAKVIGVARGEEALAAVEGLDGHIVLQSTVTETDFSGIEPDVILDYIYGDVALHLLTSLRTKRPVQYVQIGTLSGQAEISLAGPLLRSTNLTIRGAGPGSWRLSALEVELHTLVPALAKWPALSAVPVPLKDIETAWSDKSIKGRIVFVP